jgi:hypothetical protein
MGETGCEAGDVMDLMLHDCGRPDEVAERGFADENCQGPARFVQDASARRSSGPPHQRLRRGRPARPAGSGLPMCPGLNAAVVTQVTHRPHVLRTLVQNGVHGAGTRAMAAGLTLHLQVVAGLQVVVVGASVGWLPRRLAPCG